jgi:hypothetical protein
MTTCRFCKSWKHEDRMVKYGVRHYAHYECFLDAGHKLEELHDWQIVRFPYRLLKERGLIEAAEAAQARQAKQEALS